LRQLTLVTAIVFAAWWTLVALAGMLRWRRVAATGACLGLAGQVGTLVLAVSGYAGALIVAYWQVVVAVVTAASALGSLRSQDRPLSWRAATTLTGACSAGPGRSPRYPPRWCMDAAAMSLELHGWGNHVVPTDGPGAVGRQQGSREPADVAWAPGITADVHC
jgi:hypothetical protein